MDWEELEDLYFRFDAMHKGYGDWNGTPMSERDAFKRTVKQALAEKDKRSIAFQEKIAYYDRWLSNGVYYTNDEFLERVLKPRQHLMKTAVRFARMLEQIANEHGLTCIETQQFLNSPEAQEYMKEHP